MKNKILALVTSLLVMLGLLAVATPAYAAWACPVNMFCLYDGMNGTGAQYNWSNQAGTCTNIGSAWNDRGSSAANRLPGNRHARIYMHANCTGIHWGNIPNGEVRSWIGDPTVTMNNSGSSLLWYF